MSNELPNGWAVARLTELAVKITDGTHQPPKFVDAGIPFVVIGNLRGDSVDWASIKKWVSAETFAQESRRISPQIGDVLYSAVGSYGIVVQVKDNRPFMFQRHIAYIRPEMEIVNSTYLTRALASPICKEQADAAARGVAQRTVTLGDLGKFELPIAPLPEQHRIVAKIDSLFARSSRARDELAHIPKLIERYRQAVLEAAFRGDLTVDWRARHPDEIPVSPNDFRSEKRRGSRTAVAQLRADSADMGELPSTWVRAQIGRIARLQPGYAFKSDWFDTEGVRLLRGTNIVPDGTRWEDVAHLPTVMTDDYNEYRLHEGDIVIAMDRPLVSGGLKVARLSAADLPALLLQRVGRFVLQPCVDPTFLWHFLHSDLFIAHIRDQATGSDLPHISATDIESVSIALPPLSEQRVIGEQLTTLLQSILAVGSEHRRAVGMLDRLDQSILDQAFTGKLVPQDPNDEPASKLLERIQAARAVAPKAKRGRRQGAP